MQEQIIFIATGWGSKHGGINSFNYDLCLSLSNFLEGYYQVVCVVQDLVFDISRLSTIPKNLKLIKSHNHEDAVRIIRNIKNETRGRPSIWVGHDVKTGTTAIECAKRTSSKSVVIHHMSYRFYSTHQSNNAEKTMQKTESQKVVLSSADYVLAVGPTLHKSAKSLLQRAGKSTENCFEIIPGLAKINSVSVPEIPQAVTYGRLDDDIVKQGKVAIGAFAKSVKDSSTPLFLIGVSDKDTYDEQFKKIYEDLQEFSATYSEKAKVNIQPLPYKDRENVFEELRVSSASMMLSLHEGFGLAGWEAISAEVPLIISKNTGLYELLIRDFNHLLSCVHDVTITGDLEKDIVSVSDKLTFIFNNIEEQKKLANRLKKSMSQYTWERTCKSFVLSCDLDKGYPIQLEKRKFKELKTNLEVFIKELEVINREIIEKRESLTDEKKSDWLNRDRLWKQVEIGVFVDQDKEGYSCELTDIRRGLILRQRELKYHGLSNVYKLKDKHKKDKHGELPEVLSRTNSKHINPISVTFDHLVDVLGSARPELISPWNVFHILYASLFKFPDESYVFLKKHNDPEIETKMIKLIDENNNSNKLYEWLKFRMIASISDYIQQYKAIINYIDVRIIDLDKQFLLKEDISP
ncbi:glycosyltransferase family 4 protein [Paenibacillus gallinarum]|uniref:Glycosyltransferase family 4 protein n=1 Tax=Paenibacillus gallinarum TaxID=2762232 RepID=A0ABR8T3Q4_9BACL|nr:glycosyltransferase family 4 protein [Paenibacillus gallinarum]MBD7970419.1 glycosyltransferase family 4 protein [Paenibacillus gallinarum]